MSMKNPRCYFDITIGSVPSGRIVMECYQDVCPKTSSNFLALCKGDQTSASELPLKFQDSCFHRVIKGFMIQGGGILIEISFKLV